jgi:hypothetical protein
MASLTGFQYFLVNIAGFSTTVLPSDSPVVTFAYNWACSMVPCQFRLAGCEIYDNAVYCCATSFIINWAPDQPNLTFFADLRKEYGIFGMKTGILNSTSDETTSAGYVVPDWAKNATLADLQTMKDPFGRQFLGLLQSMGSLWGLS